MAHVKDIRILQPEKTTIGELKPGTWFTHNDVLYLKAAHDVVVNTESDTRIPFAEQSIAEPVLVEIAIVACRTVTACTESDS